jgi:hypothetical protein
MTFGRTSLDDLSARRKSLYLHRTTQHKKTKTNIHTLYGIRSQDLSVQAIKAYASRGAATWNGLCEKKTDGISIKCCMNLQKKFPGELALACIDQAFPLIYTKPKLDLVYNISFKMGYTMKLQFY